MDRGDLIGIMGARMFSYARNAMDDACVGTEETYPGLTATTVSMDGGSALVVTLSPTSAYCFTCRSESCIHVSMALIDRFLDDSTDCSDEDDSDAIDLISRRIEKLDLEELCEAENNYYDDSECDEVLYDLTEEIDGICRDLFSRVKNPEDRVRLFTDLCERCSAYRDYDVFPDEYMEEAVRNLSKCSFETMCGVVDRDLWGGTYIDSLDVGTLARLVEGRPVRPYLSRAYLKLDMYEQYVESSSFSSESIYEVVRRLVSSGDKVRARAFADMLSEPRGPRSTDRILYEDVCRMLGETDRVREMLVEDFIRCPDQERLSEAIASGGGTREELMTMLEADLGEKHPVDSCLALFLIRNGSADFACRALRTNGYRLPRSYTHWDQGALSVARALYRAGRKTDAIDVARANLEAVLNARDNKNYQMSVDLLNYLDETFSGDPEFSEDHEEYKGKLRSDYGKLSKFWGMYEGTYRAEGRWRRHLQGHIKEYELQ